MKKRILVVVFIFLVALASCSASLPSREPTKVCETVGSSMEICRFDAFPDGYSVSFYRIDDQEKGTVCYMGASTSFGGVALFCIDVGK